MKPTDLSLAPLKEALATLSEAVAKQNPTQLERDGVIQRFEYCFELAWKTLRRYLELNNDPKIANIKDVFREAGRQGLLDSVEDWFDFLTARNLTSHTYKKVNADKAYNSAVKFYPAATELLNRMERKLG